MKSEQLNFYSFFTQYSRMEEYGFGSGLRKRLYRKILPIVPDSDTIEYILLHKTDPIQAALSVVDFDNIVDGPVMKQLNLSIKALCTKVAAFGLDNNIRAKYHFLGLDAQAFEDLIVQVNGLSECKNTEISAVIKCLASIECLVIDLRKNKNKIGTSFYLTSTTRRVLHYIERAKQLLHLKLNITSKKHWQQLFADFIAYSKQKNSIRRYIKRHTDLVALEIVEHTSSKGEKYIAENRKEYWQFFYRSLQGGGIIALFALCKIIIDSLDLSQLNNAFLFSINYAMCFVVVKLTGGIIATKQPALTASTIVRNIDRQDDLVIDSINSITLLARKVFRSQFISIIGNFLMAISLASLLVWILRVSDITYVQDIVDAPYLLKNAMPSSTLIFYAAIAGFFLAMSGLIAGYFDNKIVATKIAYRISNHKSLSRSNKLAGFVEKKTGALLGNIFLGAFLGTAFLLSNLLPFSVDIRHIAFSSANVGYGITSYDFDTQTIALAVAGVFLIGFINFMVSFSITFYLTIKSRGANFRLIPKILVNVAKDFVTNPLAYFVARKGDNEK